MFRVLATLSLLTLSGAAMASGPYPSTLSPEERERHEFIDAQRGIRSGVEPVRPNEMSTAPRIQGRVSPDASSPMRPALPADAIGNF